MIILGLAMSPAGSLEAVSQIRRLSRAPIIVMSVRHETPAKLAALGAGADDYITKPFPMEEVLARTRTILRRTSSRLAEPIRDVYSYRCGELQVDLPGNRVTLGGEAVHLTPNNQLGMGLATGASQEYREGGLAPAVPARSLGAGIWQRRRLREGLHCPSAQKVGT